MQTQEYKILQWWLVLQLVSYEVTLFKETAHFIKNDQYYFFSRKVAEVNDIACIVIVQMICDRYIFLLSIHFNTLSNNI